MRQKEKALKRLPRIKIDMTQFTNFADQEDRILMESEIPGMIHVSVKGEGTAIVSSDRGYLLVTEDDLPRLIDELVEVHDHMKRRRVDGYI